MIRVEKAVVGLTEHDLRQILKAVDEAKESIEFIDEPMPGGDMSTDQWLVERARRGTVRIGSPYGGIAFDIQVRGQDESIGYRVIP